MNKRFLLLLLAILVVLGIFLLTDERREDLSESVFWKEDWKQILYFPGETEPIENDEFKAYLKTPVQLRKYDLGFREAPIFSIGQKVEPNPTEFVFYEGNYNVKNTFADLSVMKSKIFEKAAEETLKGYQISPKTSPKLQFFRGTNLDKEILLGKKLASDPSRIVVQSGETLLAPYLYILEKFTNPSVSFRERQILSYFGGYTKIIQFTGLGTEVRIDNDAKKNQYGAYVNHWRRPTGERIVLSPDLGNNLENQVKNFRAELFPDDESGPGFPWSRECTDGEPEAQVLIVLSNGLTIEVKFYREVVWKDVVYRPYIREFKGYFVEGPAFARAESFSTFIEAVNQIKRAKRWERPEQRIQ